MLTYSSDPLPHIVCPMDEDAIPPNHFCSAPSPHSEPPPPLLPLSSITPSCVKDGISGRRRSGRIQGISERTPKKQSDTDSGAAWKPSRHISSPSKSQRETENMDQVSPAKQPRVEDTNDDEKDEDENKDVFQFGFAAELQNQETSPLNQTNFSAADTVVKEFSDSTTQILDATKSGGLAAVENDAPAVTTRWVIGPLFQSFKSKMASFTEIVMSPVKLFMDHRDRIEHWEPEDDRSPDVEQCETMEIYNPEVQTDNENLDAVANQERLSEAEESAQNERTVAIKYSKKLSFDVEVSTTHSSELAEGCTVTEKEKDLFVSVPLQPSPLPCTDLVSEDISESIESVIRSSLLYQPSPDVSASPESILKVSIATEGPKGKTSARPKPVPRKCTGKRKKVTSKLQLAAEIKTEESAPKILQVSCMNPVQSNEINFKIDKTLCDSDPSKPEGEDDYVRKTESVFLVPCPCHDISVIATGTTPEPPLDTQQPDCQLNLVTFATAIDPESSKMALKVDDCHSQDDTKRQRLSPEICTNDAKEKELLNFAADGIDFKVPRPLKKEVASTNTSEYVEEPRRPAIKRKASRTIRRGISEEEILATINEVVLNITTRSSSDSTLTCSPDISNGVTEVDQEGYSSSCKRLKTKTGLCKPDVNTDNNIDLETTLAITSTEQTEQEVLEVLVRPTIKSTSKSKNGTKKPLKRKAMIKGSPITESDSSLVSASLLPAPSMEPLELTATDLNACQNGQKEESEKLEVNQSSKRPKRGSRGAVKPSTLVGTQETKQCITSLQLTTKESNSKEGQVIVDPLYFEMTPVESSQPSNSSPSTLFLDCYVQLDNSVKELLDGEEKATSSVVDKVFTTDAEASNDINCVEISRTRSSMKMTESRQRRVNSQRRKGRVSLKRPIKDEEVPKSISKDDSDLATTAGTTSPSENSIRLLRSYSCPEIPSFRHQDTTWIYSLHSPPQHSRVHTHTPHQHHNYAHTPSVHHFQKSVQRARRHTVCSVEVEREIAPLCLRKEVYPSRRSFPYDAATQNLSPSLAHSPHSSTLASCFLSSPLAFLSKRVDRAAAAAATGTSSHGSSPSSSTCSSAMYPSSSSSPWLSPGFLQRSESSSTALDTCSSVIPLECEIARRLVEDDGGDTSSSSHDFEDVVMREEKALSDSEIKVVQKNVERGKVSSIRIRKTLPKPQNNLTPMGLPKAIRLKKKEFTLEEIYTNKNYTKPPESRLETIFEMPFNRRDGSESWFGLKRMKRFTEFLEIGEVRKPKKPLVVVGKAFASSSRRRRGGFPKDEAPLSSQDLDSLLCAKLHELDLLVNDHQKDS